MQTMRIVAADIGGTNARFALAEVAGGRVVSLGEPLKVHTADHSGLESAWTAFARHVGSALPRSAAIAVACPVGGEVLRMTNNPWVMRPARMPAELGVDRLVLINDFGAVGHAVAEAGPEYFRHLCGPDRALGEGVTSIVGPGTGLGVALLLRRDGRSEVIETEGGHIDFAPIDSIEDQLLARLRKRNRRVSVERIVSGPGLTAIHEGLCAMEGTAVVPRDDTALWIAAMEGSDRMAAAALDRFCLCLGAVAGDIALAQGAGGVVIAGGLGLRLADVLPGSGFGQRFTAKGRFESMMAGLPVKIIVHPEPGLLGATAAFAIRYRGDGADGGT